MQFQGKQINQNWDNGKKANFEPNFGPQFFCGPPIFLWILPLLDVRNYWKLSLYVISKKVINQTSENVKKPSFGLNFYHIWPKFGPPFFFKNLAASVTRYHSQLSSCTITETNDPILWKRSDRWMERRKDGWRNRWTRGLEWFHRMLSH